MPAPSARSATRAIAVLDYFTTNPGRAFTLSELSVAVDASLSTLSSVLQSLMDAGYLIRHPRHKTYELGPALVALGHAAAQRHPVVDLARPELAGLAADFDAECIGSVVLGDEIVILAIEGRASQHTRGLTIGQRVPFRPPFGEIWLAYGGPDAVRRWLRRTRPSAADAAPDPDTVTRLHDALSKVRDRGYAVNLRSAQLTEFREALSLRTRHPNSDELQDRLDEVAASIGADYELLDEHPDTVYDPEMIIAPVFGPDESVVFALTVSGLAPRSGAEIMQVAARTVETGLGLTRAIGGRVPALDGERSAS